MIFLVDLMVAPVTLVLEDVVKLLHVVLILWEHYTLTVQEQAREMLVHLIHELIDQRGIQRRALAEPSSARWAPSPGGRRERCCAGLAPRSGRTLIRPLGTFSRREKGSASLHAEWEVGAAYYAGADFFAAEEG